MAGIDKLRYSLLSILTPLLYIGVIGGLIYLHFNRTDLRLERTENFIVTSVFGRKKQIKEISISWNNLTFPVEESYQISSSQSNQKKRSRITTYNLNNNDLSINLSEETSLRFVNESNSNFRLHSKT